MERLTNPHSHILMNQPIIHSGKEEVLWDGVYSKDVLEEMVERLAAYEDTGLTPDEIADHEEMFRAYRHVCGGKSPDEIAAMQAEYKKLRDDEAAGLIVKTCTYSQDDPDISVWECSNCDCMWSFDEGGVIKNNTRYCPECGAKITHISFVEVDYNGETYERTIKTLTREEAEAALKEAQG